MKKRPLAILPALFAALLTVLTPVATARAGFMDEKITIRQENQMGMMFDATIRAQMYMVEDTYITDYVRDIVDRIVAAKRPMPFTVRSAVIANPMLNAFAIPGGYIYIFTGLIVSVTSECQLAGVISHELAHVSQRHVASRIEKQKKISLLTTAGMLAGLFLGVAGGNAKASQALVMGSQGLGTAAMLKYSQDDEREADHVGMNALVKAGYNPEGMPEMFELMMKNKWFDTGRNSLPSYLSTHPGTSDRIIYLNDRIVRMPKVFLKRKDDNARLHKVQALIRSKMTPTNTAMAYWVAKKKKDYMPMDYVGLGIVQQRLKDLDAAEHSFDEALHLDGEDPLVVREAGIFHYKTGDYDRAGRYLQKATIKNPRDALGLFYLALLQAKQGNSKLGIQTMLNVMSMVPRDSEVHEELGMMYGKSGDTFHANLHLAYGALYSSNMKKAQYHYQKAAALAQDEKQQEELKKYNLAQAARQKVSR